MRANPCTGKVAPDGLQQPVLDDLSHPGESIDDLSTKTAAERCRAVASLGGEHPNPLAQSAKDRPPQSLLSERRPDTAQPRYRGARPLRS